MDPVRRAIWFVEGHLAEEITLDDVADVAGLSRHHMVRAFGQVTGRSVMRYVRARRLSEAARVLAAGAPDILAVALDAGYGSHEAFTRAFRDQFGITPERVREAACTAKLQLVEPMKLSEPTLRDLAAPTFETRGPMLLVGLMDHYGYGEMDAIPNQWQRFQPWLGVIPNQVPYVAYGVICNGDDEGRMDYLSAMEVKDFSDVPPELSRLRLARQHYAVFRHPGHISEMRSVWHTLWADWIPSRLKRMPDAPFFELYPESFDPQSGDGGFEIWLPVEG